MLPALLLYVLRAPSGMTHSAPQSPAPALRQPRSPAQSVPYSQEFPLADSQFRRSLLSDPQIHSRSRFSAPWHAPHSFSPYSAAETAPAELPGSSRLPLPADLRPSGYPRCAFAPPPSPSEALPRSAPALRSRASGPEDCCCCGTRLRSLTRPGLNVLPPASQC